MDPYADIRLAWTFAHKNKPADFRINGPRDTASLETLRAVLFTYQDPEFPVRATTRSVRIPSTGRKLPFSYWLRRGKAPLVYIVPGLGGHRLSQMEVAFAELLFKGGFSVVCIGNPFNPEFMERASSASLPGYLPVDGHDVHVALTEIDGRMRQLYPGRFGTRTLLGFSMGALDTLFIAAEQEAHQPTLIRFDRFVAISPPVNLMHGIRKLDDFYEAPLAWSPVERSRNLENTFLKVAELEKAGLTPQTPLPFEAIESQFLIGMTFRFTLRDIVYSSQRRISQHILHHPLHPLNRAGVYKEIGRYSYQDYFSKFAVPYYEGSRETKLLPGELARAGDLRSYAAGLRSNPDIRILFNHNDFLLEKADIA